MTDSCNACGNTTTSLMNCKRCKSVAYCSIDCQRQDWKAHKLTCQRKEFAGHPCDFCSTTENVEYGDICLNCGSLFCPACDDQNRTRDLLSGVQIAYKPCPRCNKHREFKHCCSDRKKLEKLIKESPRDPRLATWHIFLASHFWLYNNEQKAKEHYLRAGELGFGEGFFRVSEICMKNRN